MLNNIRGAVRVLLKKSWVVFLATVIFALSALVVSEVFLPKKYSASALVYVYNGRQYEQNETVSNSDVLASQELAQVVGVILKSENILQEVVQTLDLNYTVADLKQMTSSKTVDATEALMLTVTAENAGDAMLLANKIVDIGLLKVPDISEGAKMNIINYASQPTSASYPATGKNVLLAAFIGLFLSLLAIYIYEIMNQKIRSDGDLTDSQKKKMVGKLSNKKPDLQSTATRMMFALKKSGGNIVVFTSHTAKSASARVCLALAKATARSGKRVLVIETDPENGYINDSLEVENNCGFSEATAGVGIDECIQGTGIRNLYFMPFGRRRLGRIDRDALKKPVLQSAGLYDYVFISTSPIKQSADVCSYKELCAAAVLAVPEYETVKADLTEDIELLRENVSENTLLMLCEKNTTAHHAPRPLPHLINVEKRQKTMAKTL